MKRNRIITVMLAFLLVFTLVPCGAGSVYADTKVTGLVIDGVKLSWDAYDGAKGYVVSCADDSMSYGIAECASNETSIADLNQKMDESNVPGGTYSITVSACDDKGVIAGSKSDPLTFEYTTSKSRLDAPELTYQGAYVLTWKPVANADYIYIKIQENKEGVWEQATYTDANGATQPLYYNFLPDINAYYLGEGLEPGKTYRAAVYFGANKDNTKNLSSVYSYTPTFTGPEKKIEPKITNAAVSENGIVSWTQISLPGLNASDITYNVKASGFAGYFNFDAGNSSGFDLKTAMDAKDLASGNYDVNITARIPKYDLVIYESMSDYINYSYVKPEPTPEPTPEPAVEKITLTEDNTTVTGLKDKVWNGSKRTQTLTVTCDGKTLIKGTDYKVTYKNYINVGTATLTIKGLGDYTGSFKKTFTIKPKGTTLKSVTAAKKALIIKWKKNSTKMSTKRITGYEIWVSTTSKFTASATKKVTLTGYKKVSKRINGLTSKKKYYVKIRTYRTISGVTYYSSWSKYKTKKTK